MTNTNSNPIKIGTRVYTNLYNRGMGTIIAIHGEQQPTSVRRIFIGTTGGNAEFDIIFQDGRQSKRLPECILLGVQWDILEDEPIATSEEIKELIKLAEKVEQEALAEEKRIKEEKEKLRQFYLTSEEYKHLKPCPDYPSLKQVHANIRLDLKKHFPNIKFSVRGDYSAVRIHWIDGVTEGEVEAVVNKFESYETDFTGDYRDPNPSPFNDIFGGKKYVFCERDYSEKLVQRAINIIWRAYNFSYEKPTPEQFFKGQLYSTYQQHFYRDLQYKLYEVLQNLKGKD